MPCRHDSKEKTNPQTRTEQGKCDTVPEQQQKPETDLSSRAPPTRPGIAGHPNRRHWTVIEPDPSYISRPGPGHAHIIMPWQLDAVVEAPADRVDEVIAQVRDLEKAPSEGDFQACPREPALGSGHHGETVNQAAVPFNTPAASDHPRTKCSQGKSASARQGLVDRESGISLDGFPSRSMEEGGVSGLCRRNSGDASDGDASADPYYSSSSSCASAGSSAMAVDGAIIRTARAVTIHPQRAAYPYDGVTAVNRPPLPAELDRMDERLEDALEFLTDFSPGTVTPTQAGDEDEDLMLTGDRESTITLPNLDQPSEGRLGSLSLPEPHYTQARPLLEGNADGHPASAEYGRSRPASPTASESSIAETVFDVRRPTPPPPPPPQPDVVSLPSSRRRDGADPSSGVGQEEAVPAALVPRGWLGLGGSHPPPQVSRRRARVDPEGGGRKTGGGARRANSGSKRR